MEGHRAFSINLCRLFQYSSEMSVSDVPFCTFTHSELYEKIKGLLKEDGCIFIKGSPSERDQDGDVLKMIAGDIFPLSMTREKLSRNVNVLMDSGQDNEALLYSLDELSSKNKGRRNLIIHLKAKNGSIQRVRASKIGVSVSKDFIHSLRDIFGQNHVWIS